MKTKKETDIKDLQEIKSKDKLEPNQIIKIIIVGNPSVGKSSILTRYDSDKFYDDIKSTVGFQLLTKYYKKHDQLISVNFWDTAGQERFHSITNSYYKGSNGAIIVYDITKQATFESVEKWHNEVVTNCEKNIPIFLVGNKCDLENEREVTTNDGLDKAKNNNMFFIETSAKNAENIEQLFKSEILEIFLKKIQNTGETVKEPDAEIDKFKDLTISKTATRNKVTKKSCC